MAWSEQYIADTNVLIRLAQGDDKVLKVLQGKSIAVSCITEMELLAWPLIKPAELVKFKLMLEQCLVLELLPAIKQEAIIIRRHTKMKLLDAIIAATSIYLQQPLLTADTGFKRVEKLLDVVLI